MTNIDHVAYPKMLEHKSWDELIYIRKDAMEAYQANPEGHKAGYYLDEINYVSNEIHRRRHEA